MRALVMLTLFALLAGCLQREPAPAVATGDVTLRAPLVGAWIREPDAEGRVRALFLHEDGEALRVSYVPWSAAEVTLPPGAPTVAADEARLLFTMGNANRTAGAHVERVELGRVPRLMAEEASRALREHWTDACPLCEGSVETFLRADGNSFDLAKRPVGDELSAAREAFQQADAAFVANGTHELPYAGATAAPPCLRVRVIPDNARVEPGEAVLLNVTATNCGSAAVVAKANPCAPDFRGLGVSVGTGRDSGWLAPGGSPQPARGQRGCGDAGEPHRIEPGAALAQRYAWDGSFEALCGGLPDAPCDRRLERAPGAYRIGATFFLEQATGGGYAEATVLLLPAHRQVPVILVSENYTKSRVSKEIPAQGPERCETYTRTRDPMSFTSHGPETANASALVLREFHQGGYGTFGPATHALLPNGTLALDSMFEPGRVLATLEARGDAFFLDDELLGHEARAVEAAFNTTWEGEWFSITERLEVRLAGSAPLFLGARDACPA